jgi:hypothetical protein
MEQLGAGNRPESVETILQSTLKLDGPHRWEEVTPSKDLVSSGADGGETRRRRPRSDPPTALP